jgi:nitrite reductase/ring-hydroxylating ferredoxin subunit
MAQEFRVCKTDEIPAGEGKRFEVNGQLIAIWNVNGTFYATSDLCPHMDGPMSEGSMEGRLAVCPIHSFMYDVATGRGVEPEEAKEEPLPCYGLRVDCGEVYITM